MFGGTKRFLEQEKLTFNLELRQYNNAYTVVGKKTITVEELNYMIENPDKGMKVTEGDTTVTIEGLQFDIANDKDLTEGYFVYSVVQFAKDTWIDAKGDAEYRWTYTGDATVLKDGANMPDPIVWLYNLDEDTSRGALIRSILNELEIPVGTVTNENLNQNIGYLVDWDGYDPVEDPYSTESYNVEYILMGNLAETKLDQFLDGMIENNIRVNLKSVPTAWTASKTFAELFDIMAEEDEVFQAIFALDDLIYDAELLTEEKYGNSDHWRNFKVALDAANAAMGLEEEELEEKGGAEFLWDAYDALQNQYLLVTGTELLDGELELILEENEDGTYNLSAQVHGEENPAFSYKWMYTSTTTAAVLENVPAADLYKVKLEVNGTDGFYGKLTASLKVPSDPAFTLSAGKTSVSVQLQKMEAVMNMPAVDKYVVQLYKDGVEIAEKEVVSGTVTFDGLTKSTEYTVKVCAYNEVGRSDIIEGKMKTSAGSSGGGSSSSSRKEETKKEDVTEEDTSEEIADMEKPAEDTATESSVDAIEKFKDVKAKDWFAPAVSYVYEKGLMSGVEVDEFGAYMTTTRAMIWTVLARMDGVTTSSQGEWYEAGREWAMKNGISDGTDPMGNITREQLASMLYRYAKYTDETVTTKGERLDQFKDNAVISEYAVQAMNWAVGEGIINGNDDGTLNPDGNAQRVHAAQMLMNFDKIMK